MQRSEQPRSQLAFERVTGDGLDDQTGDDGVGVRVPVTFTGSEDPVVARSRALGAGSRVHANAKLAVQVGLGVAGIVEEVVQAAAMPEQLAHA